MTIEEAIEQLNAMISVYNEGKCTTAMSVAIKALEKQIPMKPVIKKHENRVPEEQDVLYCPCCDNQIYLEPIDNRKTYCIECGQAIDWSEEGEG